MKHLLKLGDLTTEEILSLLDLADKLKKRERTERRSPILRERPSV